MKKLQKLTLAALLTAAGLVVFVIEAQLPPLTAIPGIKPGLSNVFTMLTLFWVGPGWALGTMFVRVSLGSLLTGQTMAFFYSLSGGFAAFLVMWALRKPLGEQKLWVLSAFGAMGHNLADGGGGLHQPHKRNFVLSSGPAGFRHCDRDFYRSVRAARIKTRAAGRSFQQVTACSKMSI